MIQVGSVVLYPYPDRPGLTGIVDKIETCSKGERCCWVAWQCPTQERARLGAFFWVEALEEVTEP